MDQTKVYDKDCVPFFMAHDQSINKNSEEITEMQRRFNGLPEKIDALTRRVDDMCELLKTGQESYLKKEQFAIEKELVNKQIGANEIGIKKLNDKYDKVILAILAMAIGLLSDIFKNVLLK